MPGRCPFVKSSSSDTKLFRLLSRGCWCRRRRGGWRGRFRRTSTPPRPLAASARLAVIAHEAETQGVSVDFPSAAAATWEGFPDHSSGRTAAAAFSARLPCQTLDRLSSESLTLPLAAIWRGGRGRRWCRRTRWCPSPTGQHALLEGPAVSAFTIFPRHRLLLEVLREELPLDRNPPDPPLIPEYAPPVRPRPSESRDPE